MLVKKNVLNEIKKGAFTKGFKKNVLNKIKKGAFTQGFKGGRKIKKKVSQDVDDLQNLLIKLGNC